MDSMILIWLAIALLFLIMEMGSPGLFYFLSFCFGALAAALAGWFEHSPTTQSVIFLCASAIALFILKYFLDRSHANAANHKTNVYALQGKKGLVLQEIQRDQTGLVKIGGETWTARSTHGETIAQGTTIEVVHIQGASVIVKEHIE